MKKIISVLLTALLALSCLSACGRSSAASSASAAAAAISSDSGKLRIVATIFPEYDWVLNILGTNPGNAEVTLLLDSGVDLHSFQPTAADILKIADSDIFLYVGGESDEWVEDVLEESASGDRIAINLLEILGDSVKEEEVVEGMQEEEEEEHDHNEDHEDEDHEEDGHDHEEGPEYDEHVWLSLKNAAVLVDHISQSIQAVDPSNADLYASNTEAYLSKIRDLDIRYEEAVSGAELNTLLFGDRFPFRYLVDDYGLNYYAAFVGCSAETEASFETITFLSGKVDELALPAVMTIEGADHRIAETIIDNTQTKDQQILTMNSMQATTARDVTNGENYLAVMEHNLTVLTQALNHASESEAAPAASDSGESPLVPDIDLTEMSSTMVYSTVYNMMVLPKDYLGKVVKMTGTFTVYHDPETDLYYYGCIIQDATACCAQGIEFVPEADLSYPGDFPEVGSDITVIGIFDTYEEGEYTYCTLRQATMLGE